MSRLIKPSSDMRSLRRPQGVVASREASADGRKSESKAARLAKFKRTQYNQAKRQKTGGEGIIQCYNLTRAMQSKIRITSGDTLDLEDADEKKFTFKWRTVGLTRDGMVLSILDNAQARKFRLQFNSQEIVRFQSFAFDHNARVHGIEAEPIATASTSPPLEKHTTGKGRAPRVVSQGKIGSRSKILESKPHKPFRPLTPSNTKPLAISSPLIKGAKARRVSLTPDRPALSPTRIWSDSTTLALTQTMEYPAETAADEPAVTSALPSRERIALATEVPEQSSPESGLRQKEDKDFFAKASEVYFESNGALFDTKMPKRMLGTGTGTGNGKAFSPEPPINLESKGRVKRELSITNLVDDDNENHYLLDPDPDTVSRLEASGFKAFVYTFKNGRSIRITASEACRLDGLIYLDDTLIQFYLQLAMDELATNNSDYSEHVYLFNPFFFSKVSQGDDPTRYMGKHSVLDKKILIMPIHLRLHWELAVIVGLDKYNEFEKIRLESQKGSSAKYRRKTTDPRIKIVILNSLDSYNAGSGGREVFKNVCASISALYSAQNLPLPTRAAFSGIEAEVPQQTNGSDCGVYAVHFCQCILAKPQEFINEVGKSKNLKLKCPEFWCPEELEDKRTKLSEQLYLIHDEAEFAKVYADEDTDKSQEHDDSDDIEVIEHSCKVRRSSRNLH